jgi:rod shape-determining protein MreC
VRLIAYGRGDRLELRDIPLSAGVEVGDEIVTSGLGGRFPAGFPVGRILKLRPDDTHAFLVGELEPAAKLDRGRNVLLLRSVPAIPRLPVTQGLELPADAAGTVTPPAHPAPTRATAVPPAGPSPTEAAPATPAGAADASTAPAEAPLPQAAPEQRR